MPRIDSYTIQNSWKARYVLLSTRYEAEHQLNIPACFMHMLKEGYGCK
jgi:hypothetical protein